MTKPRPFTKGQRVRMTNHGILQFKPSRPRQKRGLFIRRVKGSEALVVVKRECDLYPQIWHEDFWEADK